MAAEVQEDGAAGSDFERALAGEASRARGKYYEVRRDAANTQTTSGTTGPSVSVGEVRLEQRWQWISGRAPFARLWGVSSVLKKSAAAELQLQRTPARSGRRSSAQENSDFAKICGGGLGNTL